MPNTAPAATPRLITTARELRKEIRGAEATGGAAGVAGAEVSVANLAMSSAY